MRGRRGAHLLRRKIRGGRRRAGMCGTDVSAAAGRAAAAHTMGACVRACVRARLCVREYVHICDRFFVGACSHPCGKLENQGHVQVPGLWSNQAEAFGVRGRI